MATQAFPYDRLSDMSDEEVQRIWWALIASNCGCFTHSDSLQEHTPELEDWATAVYSEITRRGLSSKPEPEPPLACEQCGGDVSVESADFGPDSYIVCTHCKTRRLMGDHMNCRLGKPEPLLV